MTLIAAHLTLPQTLPALGTDLDALHPTPKARVLIVDDDPDYIALVKVILRQANFDVSGVLDPRAALQQCTAINPDIILLDYMMPEVDGHQVFRDLRKVTNAPIIFVTAAPDPDLLYRTFDLGAEDFISKPFNNSEIIARIRKSLRQARATTPISARYFPHIDLRLDLESHEVTLHGLLVRLLPREFSLLAFLSERAPHCIPYQQLTLGIWAQDTPKTRAHLKTVAFALRRKLEQDPSRPGLVVNNRSIGYQLLTQP